MPSGERAPHGSGVQRPGRVHVAQVDRALRVGERRVRRLAVPRDREQRRRAVDHDDAGAGERELHEHPSGVARRVVEALLAGRHPDARGEVVRAEMGRHAAPAGRGDERGQRHAPVRVDERAGRLDHELDADLPAGEAERLLERAEQRRRARPPPPDA